MVALTLLMFVAGFTLLRLARLRDRSLVQYAGAGLLFHVVCAFAQDWVNSSYYAGFTDVAHFAEIGAVIARTMEVNFGQVAPEVLKMLVHVDARLPFGWVTYGSGTTSTEALTGLLFYIFGSSLIVSFLAVSVLAWFTQLYLARTVRELVTEHEAPLAYVSLFLVPSVVFWSSGITKEAFVFIGLCLLCAGTYRVLAQRRFTHIVSLVGGALLIGLIKPYTLFPFVLALSAWILVARSQRLGSRGKLRALPAMLAACVAVGGVLIVGRIFPDFSLERITESAAQQQAAWGDTSSQLDVGAGEATLSGQAAQLPLGLLNSLFRPFLFESRSLTAVAASLETTAIITIVVIAIWRFRLRTMRAAVLESPLVAASLTFTLFFGIAVGLVTRNMGSLSRYRMPMVPFYVLAIVLLVHRLRATQGARLTTKGALSIGGGS